MCRNIFISVVCALAMMLPTTLISAQGDTAARGSRLVVGGYGEAVYSRHFYSDNPFRYSFPERYSDMQGHGQVDLPHAVLMLGYDFGKGWSMGTEIEFEHGGVEAAVEMEAEESGEFEKEIERGGEVALEQFWVQKSFGRRLNIRAGHIVVPVGMTNNSHLPNQFFGVYRPEGENTILPCTWHETGLSLWGRLGAWRYEVQLLPGLNSRLMNASGWIHGASASPYEFRPANNLAGAMRVDWSGVEGLRLSVSGYVGNSFNNDIRTDVYGETSRYRDVRGTVLVGAFDFAYRNRWLTVRGNCDYGHLGDAQLVSSQNQSQNNSSGSPYPHTQVGAASWDAGLEAGVDVMAWNGRSERLYLFGRYDHYDSYVPASGRDDIGWAERQVLSCGLNYCPLPEVVVKAEAGIRLLADQYNDEPFFAIGITWTGFFKH